MKKKASFL